MTCTIGTEHRTEWEAQQCNFGSFIEACDARLKNIAANHPDEQTRAAAQEALDSRTRKKTSEIHAPYRMEQRGDKWVVVNDNGEVKGTHDTKEQAREQQKALYVNVPGAPEMAEEKHKGSKTASTPRLNFNLGGPYGYVSPEGHESMTLGWDLFSGEVEILREGMPSRVIATDVRSKEKFRKVAEDFFAQIFVEGKKAASEFFENLNEWKQVAPHLWHIIGDGGDGTIDEVLDEKTEAPTGVYEWDARLWSKDRRDQGTTKSLDEAKQQIEKLVARKRAGFDWWWSDDGEGSWRIGDQALIYGDEDWWKAVVKLPDGSIQSGAGFSTLDEAKRWAEQKMSGKTAAEFPPKEDEAPKEKTEEPADTGNRPEPWPESACGDPQGDTFCVLDVGHEGDHIYRSRQWIETILPPPAAAAPSAEGEDEVVPEQAPEDQQQEAPAEDNTPEQFKKSSLEICVNCRGGFHRFCHGKDKCGCTCDENTPSLGMRVPELYAIVINPEVGEIASTEGGFQSHEEAERYLADWDFGPDAYITTLDEAMALNLSRQSVRKKFGMVGEVFDADDVSQGVVDVEGIQDLMEYERSLPEGWHVEIVDTVGFVGMRKGAPFAGYDDFADCVAKNSDKDDPEAYCGSIKHKVEDGKTGILVIAQNPYLPDANPFLNQNLAPAGTPDDMLDGPPKSPAVTTVPMTTKPRQLPGGSTPDGQPDGVTEHGSDTGLEQRFDESEGVEDNNAVVSVRLPMICLSTGFRFQSRLIPGMRCRGCGQNDYELDEVTAMMDDVPMGMMSDIWTTPLGELEPNDQFAVPFVEDDEFDAEVEETLGTTAEKFRQITLDVKRTNGVRFREAMSVALQALRVQGAKEDHVRQLAEEYGLSLAEAENEAENKYETDPGLKTQWNVQGMRLGTGGSTGSTPANTHIVMTTDPAFVGQWSYTGKLK